MKRTPPSRRFHFSLRSVILLTTVIAAIAAATRGIAAMPWMFQVLFLVYLGAASY